MKFQESIKVEAVKSIVSGELSLKDVMKKYNVKKKDTIVAWMKRLLPEIKGKK